MSIDLGAFCRAAGYAAELHEAVHVGADDTSVYLEAHDSLLAGILAGLSTLVSFDSFSLSCTVGAFVAHIAALDQLQCCCYRLELDVRRPATLWRCLPLST